jgi:hypothetical protein
MTATVPRLNGEATREKRATSRFLRHGAGIVALAALIGMVALIVSFVVVTALLSMVVG